MLTDDELLEALEMYIDMNEKKDEIIQNMGKIILKQATDLANLRNIETVELQEEKK
jgi:hypothetical protein